MVMVLVLKGGCATRDVWHNIQDTFQCAIKENH